MDAAGWAIVVLTLVLIVVTGFYAWQTRRLAGDTARMADLAEREARERQASEEESRRRTAAGLLVEIQLVQATLSDLDDDWKSPAVLKRNLARLSALPRHARVFDSLVGQIGSLGGNVVLEVVGVYTVMAGISTSAEVWDGMSVLDIPGPDIQRLQRGCDTLQKRMDAASHALLGVMN